MEDHQEVIQDRHQVGAVDVGDVDDQNHGKDEQSALPVLRVIVGVSDADQRLDDGSSEKRARGSTGLPCQHGHPACIGLAGRHILRWQSRHGTGDITEEFLVSRRGKLRDPVILTSGGWCHRRHLRERGNDESEADEGPDIRPEQSGESSVRQAFIVGTEPRIRHCMHHGYQGLSHQDKFPCRLQNRCKTQGSERAQISLHLVRLM